MPSATPPSSGAGSVSREQYAALEAERDRLAVERSYLADALARACAERDEQKKLAAWLRSELERLAYNAKTPRERVDPASVQLVFEPMFQELFGTASFGQQQEDSEEQAEPGAERGQDSRGGSKPKGGRKGNGHGRRKLDDAAYAHLPIETIELEPSPLPEGAMTVGTDVTWRLGYRRGGYVRIRIVRRAYAVTRAQAEACVYTTATALDSEGKLVARTTDAPAEARSVSDAAGGEPGDMVPGGVTAMQGLNVSSSKELVPAGTDASRRTLVRGLLDRTIVMAPTPAELIPKGLPSPELLAHLLYGKFRLHLPFNRQQMECERAGVPITRGTMCAWEAAAHEVGRFVVEAMEGDARKNAHLVLTDATGVLVQAKERCKHGHFFVYIADRKHVVVRYDATHSGKEAASFFSGFKGTVLSDASAIYNILFGQEDGPEEANCWSHGRRYFYKAVESEHREEALMGVGFANQLFAWEKDWKKEPPSRRLELRQKYAAPLLARMRQWLDEQLGRKEVHDGSRLRKALNYVDNQWEGLNHFLKDGRVPIHNNESERKLRHIAVGRNSWIFVYSDETAPWTATFVSLLLSCELHGLDGERYLRDLVRVLPSWPKNRMLELAPAYWKETRARLNEVELSMPLGPLTIPPRLENPAPAGEAHAEAGDAGGGR